MLKKFLTPIYIEIVETVQKLKVLMHHRKPYAPQCSILKFLLYGACKKSVTFFIDFPTLHEKREKYIWYSGTCNATKLYSMHMKNLHHGPSALVNYYVLLLLEQLSTKLISCMLGLSDLTNLDVEESEKNTFQRAKKWTVVCFLFFFFMY